MLTLLSVSARAFIFLPLVIIYMYTCTNIFHLSVISSYISLLLCLSSSHDFQLGASVMSRHVQRLWPYPTVCCCHRRLPKTFDSLGPNFVCLFCSKLVPEACIIILISGWKRGGKPFQWIYRWIYCTWRMCHKCLLPLDWTLFCN